MTRKYNFSAGPAALPTEVLEQAQAEMLDWNGTGVSVMEMSHRSKEFIHIAETAEADLRELLAIPDNYKVLFLQGGAHSQFAAIPLNLLRGKDSADYLDMGIWSRKAIAEASRYCKVNVVSSSEATNNTSIAPVDEWQTNPNAAYLHYVYNETIGGLELSQIPKIDNNVPLIADLSSTILSRPVDVSKYGMIYAGAQKNIGPAGLTLVIVREDLLGEADKSTPTMLNYKIHADTGSMYNTPATFSWYLSGLVFKWIKKQGGLIAMADVNQRKSLKLYNAIDDSSFYSNLVEKQYRSWMNVPFTLADNGLNDKFLDLAAKNNLVTLKGHKSVGGMRASIYNAMPEAGVDALLDFMNNFETQFA
ncbi:UNVERIFIED_CONTAM: hypothetical protein GTU68_038187 [Idotea baltica]|nr:hypothetical protein [Idotea baltica]